MSNTAILKVTSQSDLRNLSNDFKSLATDSASAGKSVQTLSTNMSTVEKSTTSFSSKLKSVGSTFQNTISQGSTFAFTLVNLQRQYRDLGDAQIAVDRTTLKVSKSQEAANKATEKVKALADAGKQGTDAYNQALLDQKQALEQLHVAQQNASEAQERFGDVQQNFWVGLVPTISSAGGTLISMIQDLGGTKGIGGLIGKFGGLKSAMSGISGDMGGLSGNIGGLTKTLGLLGLAIAGAKVAWDEYNKTAKMVNDIHAGTVTTTEGVSSRLKDLAAIDFSSLEAGLGTIIKNVGPGGATADLLNRFGGLDKQIKTTGDDFGKFWDASAWARVGDVIPLKINKVADAVDAVGTAASQASSKLSVFFSAGGGLEKFTGLLAKTTTGTDPFANIAKSLPVVNTNLSEMARHGQEIGQLGLQLSGVIGPVAKLDSTTAGANTRLSQLMTTTKAAVASDNAYHSALVQLLSPFGSIVNLNDLAIPQLEALYKLWIQNAQKAKAYAAELNNVAKANERILNQKVPGYQYKMKGGKAVATKTVGGPRYVTFVNHKITGYGPGVAPPTRAGKQHGFHDYVDSPTWMLMGENGREEVDINPPGKSGRGGGGSGDIYVGPIYLDGEKIQDTMRLKMNRFQGTFK